MKEACDIRGLIARRHARRRGLRLAMRTFLVGFDLSEIRHNMVWDDPRDKMRRVLLVEHKPCVVCGRQTRWAAVHHLVGRSSPVFDPPRYCSYACLRTRPPS